MGLLRDLKIDSAEVDEAMFQGVERRCKFIVCLQGTEKSDLDEIA
jgi:hypothetical protein